MCDEGGTAADSPTNRTEASPLAHCPWFPEAPLIDASPTRALVLAWEENAGRLAILAYNAGLFAAGVSEGGRDGVLFSDADIVLAVAEEETARVDTWHRRLQS